MLFKKSLIKTKYIANIGSKNMKCATITSYPPYKGNEKDEMIKEYKDWSKKDLRKELKKFGQEVSEDVDRNEMVQKLKDFSSKDLNKKGEQQKRSYTTATMGTSGQTGSGKDFGNWSINDLKDELKKFGEKVSDNMKKSEMVQKVKDLYKSDSNKSQKKRESSFSVSAMNISTHTGTQQDYSSWSMTDLRDEMKRFGQKVSDNMNKSELVQKLKEFSSKDSFKNMPQSSFSASRVNISKSKNPTQKDYTNWSKGDLKDEMKRFGQEVTQNMHKNEMIQKLNHLSSENTKNEPSTTFEVDINDWSVSEMKDELRKFGYKNSNTMEKGEMVQKLQDIHKDKFDIDYNSWTVTDLVKELKRFGQDVSDKIEKSELVQKMKDFYKDKIQPSNSTIDYDNWTMSDLKEEMKKIGQEVSDNIQQSEMVQKIKDFYMDKIQPTTSSFDFENWTMSDLKDEMKKIGQEVSENVQQSDMVQKLKEFYKDKIQPTTRKMDFENWSMSDLKEEMQKIGQEVSENIQQSEIVQKLKEFYRDDKHPSHFQKGSGIDYSTWSSSDLRDETIQKSDIIQPEESHLNMNQSHSIHSPSSQFSGSPFTSSPFTRSPIYSSTPPVSSTQFSSTQKDYSNWSIGDLRDEMKKIGQKVSEKMNKSEIIQKLQEFNGKHPSQLKSAGSGIDYSTWTSYDLRDETIQKSTEPEESKLNMNPSSSQSGTSHSKYTPSSSSKSSSRSTFGSTHQSSTSHSSSGAQKDYSNWSLSDLRKELKKFGQNVSDSIQKSELIQKLREMHKNDSNHFQQRRMYTTIAGGHSKGDFASWSVKDLAKELKYFGENVTEKMQKSDLVQKLTDLYKKDTHVESPSSNEHPVSEKDYSNWSINELREELKKYCIDVPKHMQKSEMIHELKSNKTYLFD